MPWLGVLLPIKTWGYKVRECVRDKLGRQPRWMFLFPGAERQPLYPQPMGTFITQDVIGIVDVLPFCFFIHREEIFNSSDQLTTE